MQNANLAMTTDLSVKPQPALHTLPSELRRLIVSFLAPHPDCHHPGNKQDLKNANATHSCLRECTPEYLFRDMALNHVLVGMSSQLERFAIDPSNHRLLEFVKHIRVQVPPALRWEVGMDGAAFGQHVEDVTARRLCAKFRIQDQRQMSDDQLEYCSDYYRAMVEPFTNNRTWYRLQRAALSSWRKIFSHFTNLAEISVGYCDIVDQPRPTCTNTFVSQHGKDVVDEPHPRFLEDATVNMTWASTLVIRTAPTYVKQLRLSMANWDNFNSFATVNQLQSLSFRKPLDNNVVNLTSLILDIQGIAGTHGRKDWVGDTGSAGSVKHWKGMLNSIKRLRHLELRDAMRTDDKLNFSELQLSDEHACILDWLLPDLILNHLQTLCLADFVLDIATVQTTLSGQWPALERLTLRDIKLLKSSDIINLFDDETYSQHQDGKGWVETCRALRCNHPGWIIVLHRPSSVGDGILPYEIVPKYLKLLQAMSNLRLGEFEVSQEVYSSKMRWPENT
ncbi:hypothetical protein DE146DRAFT_660337 [Phaeosphaeria sp. MPI-PUGE-AT-0046c]|nr:hypothetical protein DE146DRAFT_660337 [Phaeosphaeria sp. MPI-PUGE-AT-0046c]